MCAARARLDRQETNRRRVSAFAESVVEEAALAWLGALGYTVHLEPTDTKAA